MARRVAVGQHNFSSHSNKPLLESVLQDPSLTPKAVSLLMDLMEDNSESDGTLTGATLPGTYWEALFARLARTCGISTLDLTGCNLGAEQGYIVGEAIKSASNPLYRLDLGRTLLKAKGFLYVARAMEQNTRLRRLGLDGVDATDEGANMDGLYALAKALPLSGLTDLDISNNNIGDYGASPEPLVALAVSIAPSRTLRYLSLRSTAMGVKGLELVVEAFATKGPNENLIYLDLSDNALRSEGCQILAGVVRKGERCLAALRHLILDNNDLTDYGHNMAGVLGLADALREATASPQSTIGQDTAEPGCLLGSSINRARRRGGGRGGRGGRGGQGGGQGGGGRVDGRTAAGSRTSSSAARSSLNGSSPVFYSSLTHLSMVGNDIGQHRGLTQCVEALRHNVSLRHMVFLEEDRPVLEESFEDNSKDDAMDDHEESGDRGDRGENDQ